MICDICKKELKNTERFIWYIDDLKACDTCAQTVVAYKIALKRNKKVSKLQLDYMKQLHKFNGGE